MWLLTRTEDKPVVPHAAIDAYYPEDPETAIAAA
jgi:hypothetical protein